VKPRFQLSLSLFSFSLSLALTSLAPWAHGEGLTVTATPSWVSEYMFRGQRRAGSSFQPSVEADGSGWSGGVWMSFPVADRFQGQANPETDAYASYTANLGNSLSLQPGFTFYNFARGTGTPSAFEPNLALNWSTDGIRLSPKIYEDVTRQIFTGEINAVTAVPLRAWGTELDLGATLGDYSGHGERGGYWLAQATLPYQLGAHARASVGYGYTEGFSGHNVPLEASRGVVTVSLAYTF
jgi:uncharacterized protein (TIGR02001 family)